VLEQSGGRKPQGAGEPQLVSESDLRAACSRAAEWPRPGRGATWRRFELLAELAQADLALGRLVEAHVDALAILDELGSPHGAGADGAGSARWGVWAAGPAGSVRAERRDGRWCLRGAKWWCSGATLLTHALVDAATADGQRLFAVDLTAVGVCVGPPGWIGPGMVRTDTRTVEFLDVAGAPVGDPGQYLDRPGFWAGAIGVAACWYGGTAAVADALWAPMKEPDPHGLVHRARVHVALTQDEALLRLAADRIDDDPGAHHAVLARTVRSTVAANATAVIDDVGRALGPAPLAFDARHGRAVLDLQVYVRQEHAERDLEALGRDLERRGAGWAP